MPQATKIIILMLLVDLECINVNVLPEMTNEISVTFDKSKIKESVVNYYISYDSFKCDSEILWRCFNLKMWKKRKRVVVSNLTESLLRLRVKRTPTEVGVGYLVQGETITESVTAMSSDSLVIERFKREWPLHLWRRYGLFTDNFIQHINPHWLSFPPSDPSVYYTLGGLYIVMVVVGSIGNSVVMLMYFRSVE